MDKTEIPIVGGVYVLGLVDMFIARFMALRSVGSFDQATTAAILWPVELIRLLF